MTPRTKPQSPLWKDSQTFRSAFTFVRTLASGTEGTVSRWENTTTDQLVAVKTPRSSRSRDLLNEIAALKKVPPFEHIVSLLTHFQKWEPIGPALVFELAEWGSVYVYRRCLLIDHDKVPEMTLWKFLRDMSLALDWLHNQMDEPHCHGDLKPENILVFSPPGWTNEGVPVLPTFKICDISRLRSVGANVKFCGTYEYGPPHAERQVKQTPAVDVFSIGASLQWFALGVRPVVPAADFIKYKKEQGGYVPTLTDLKAEAWRAIVPYQYRPLNASIEFQRDVLKLAKPVAPYSHGLSQWYDRLVEEQVEKRITSRSLARQFVPFADVYIDTLIRQQQRENARQRYEEAQHARQIYEAAGSRVAEAMVGILRDLVRQ
jgi:serine/threonine protein kinase